jgi:integrase
MKKTRGVFEQPKGSGIWWTQHYNDGQRHREKVGRKSDAIALYQKRKADARAGVKLPRMGGSRGTLLAHLIDDVVSFTSDHKSAAGYASKGWIIKRDLGMRVAESITPQEIDAWLKERGVAPATVNRYKSFFSLCYREGMANGKVSTNPAKLVRHRRESAGRLRFLSRDEYDQLMVIIATKYPEHVAEFVVSVHTGMRLSEQYKAMWRQFIRERRVIELSDTKNTAARTVHLNAVAFAAIESVRPPKAVSTARIFSGPDKQVRNRWFYKCIDAAGIDNYTWHNNRHTFGSWLAMSGASLKEIQVAGGWKTIQMAARYSHLSPAHAGSVVDRLVTA